MGVTRTPCAYRIDTWTPGGESIVEHVAGIEDYQVALAHPYDSLVRESRFHLRLLDWER